MKLIRRGWSGNYKDRDGNYVMPYVEIVNDSCNMILATEAIRFYLDSAGRSLTLKEIQAMEPLEEMKIRYRSK